MSTILQRQATSFRETMIIEALEVHERSECCANGPCSLAMRLHGLLNSGQSVLSASAEELPTFKRGTGNSSGQPKRSGPYASEKQRKFIRGLANTRDVLAEVSEVLIAESKRHDLTVAEACKMIDSLKPLPYKPKVETRQAAAPSVSEGFYVMDGEYYKVARTKSSGRTYAKVWDGYSWIMARGVIYQLTDAHRASEDDAVSYGQRFGRCMNCGKTLTNETSIAAAMGPICRDRLGF